MEFTVTSRGPTLEALTRTVVRDLEQATRTVGRDVAKVGSKAIKSGAPRFAGKQLTVRTRTQVSGHRAEIEFIPKPAGAWAIVESGAKAHQIKAHNRALKLPNGYAAVVSHPGTSGHQAWTKAGPRLEDAVTPVVEDAYDEALT